MTDLIENFLIEIAIFSFFGLLYYFYQKKKILHFEANKNPIIMEMILQSCLNEKSEETPQTELDTLIENLDDFLQEKTTHPPIQLLKDFLNRTNYSQELRDVILEGLKEIEAIDEK